MGFAPLFVVGMLDTMKRANLKTLPCGCTVFTDPEWGVTRSYKKCAFHISEGGKSGIAHHEVMGAIKDGVVQHDGYVSELVEPLVEMDAMIPLVKSGRLLEIGCGVGSYIPYLMGLGYDYVGAEMDGEVSIIAGRQRGWKNGMWDTPIIYWGGYEGMPIEESYDVIFCAHAFEHMADAPGMMAKAFSQLKPGGRLVLIIPNDEDLCNPDHLWFFNETSLRSTLMRIGFQDIRMASKRRVPQEMFIYCAAVKPL